MLTLKTDYPQTGTGHYEQLNWWWSGIHDVQVEMSGTDSEVCDDALKELNAQSRSWYYVCSVPFDAFGRFTRPTWSVIDARNDTALAWKMESLRSGRWADKKKFTRQLNDGHVSIRRAVIDGTAWYEYDIGPSCDESKDEWLDWHAAKGRSFFVASGDPPDLTQVEGLGDAVELVLYNAKPYFYSFSTDGRDKSGQQLHADRQEVFLHKIYGTESYVRVCRFQFAK